MRVLSINETAELLDVCEKTIHRWTKSGRLPSSKIGHRRYILEEDIRRILKPEEGALTALNIIREHAETKLTTEFGFLGYEIKLSKNEDGRPLKPTEFPVVNIGDLRIEIKRRST